jgi:hypothetical protein
MATKSKKATKTTTKKTTTTQASDEAYKSFVQVWNAAATKDEVVEKTGLSAHKVSAWSYNLRKRGVPLKKFKVKPAFDLKELTAIAKAALA